MLTATFRTEAHAIRLLTQHFNLKCDLSPILSRDHKLTFVPGYNECSVTGEDNSVMRFIGDVAQFGAVGLIRVESSQPQKSAQLVPDFAAGPKIPLHHMAFEIDPSDHTLMSVRLVVCPLPTESWPDKIRKYDCVWEFERRAVTPAGYYGAAFYRLKD